MDVYKTIRVWSTRPTFGRELTGRLRITEIEIIDEHFAKATGKAGKDDVVELSRKKWGAALFEARWKDMHTFSDFMRKFTQKREIT